MKAGVEGEGAGGGGAKGYKKMQQSCKMSVSYVFGNNVIFSERNVPPCGLHPLLGLWSVAARGAMTVGDLVQWDFLLRMRVSFHVPLLQWLSVRH